jgi:transketolase
MQEIIERLDKADSVTGKPVIIIANTIKGCGISFAENVVAFHNGAMTPEQYELALQELGGK